MIRVTRIELDETLENRLNYRTLLLTRRGADPRSARRSWKGATAERAGIKNALSQIAAGIERCMYCGDSRGTDIDHFEPIKSAPLRTFDWHNHLLACSSCNSNAKRNAFPCDRYGQSLLVDPSAEEPSDHIELTLSIGKYTGITYKGRVTIDVFQLNRADLSRGREVAFARCKSMLRDYLNLETAGRHDEAASTKLALETQPFADVLHAMFRVTDRPGAATVLGGSDVLKVLRRWRDKANAED
jgi:uncharacterized protein (TIGR02646 family)